MAKYLRKFETTSAYSAAESTLDKPNVSYIVETNGVEFKPWVAPMNIITYKASAKLAEVTGNYNGLHTNAFSGTSGQLTMTKHTFENCVGTIEFNGDVTSIGNDAFNSSRGLTSVTIPSSVTSIGEGAFGGCSGLTRLNSDVDGLFNISDSVTSIGSSAFSGCSGLTSITIPDSVTSIGQQAFSNCTSITSITIPDSVTSIGERAFNGCSSLTSVTIPNSVTSIGNNAFYDCSGLTSINIPDGVTSIGSYAFRSCTGLTSITISNSVTSISRSAFQQCTGLTSIVVDSGNTVYDSRDNCNAIINTSTNELVAGCKNTVIPNTVTSIGEEAFSYCTSLTSITIPNGITSIGPSAFDFCTGLTSVTIGSGVTSIGVQAFNNCSGLTNIVSNATTAPTIQNTTFLNVKTGGTLYVPSGSTGYAVWMGYNKYYLGKYSWTKVEQ